MYRRFLPSHLLRRLSAAAPAGVAAHDTAAAVLIVDIVGYTELMERFSNEAEEGVERLSLALREMFDLIEHELLARGGDIFTFAGDSVIALWLVTEDRALGSRAREALAAALAINESVARLARSRPEAPLRVRACVAASQVTLFFTGGHQGDWRFFAAGAALRDAAQGLRVAAPSTVACAPLAWPMLHGCVQGSPAEGGYVRLGLGSRWNSPAPPGQDTAALPAPELVDIPAQRRFVPELVLNYLDAGHAEWLSEFRRVTTLFIGLRTEGGSESTPLDDLQRAVLAIQVVVRRHDGAVARVSCDDKGMHALCAWGVPGRLHDDDAVRALEASLELRPLFPGRGLSAGMGISTGRVLCGLSGGSRRCEYTVSGATVNLAAHLMAAAGNETLCDSATAHAGRMAAEFEQLQSAIAKVPLTDTAIWRVLPTGSDAHDAALVASRLAGRQMELKRFLALLDALVDGKGATVVIAGPPGVGKSTFVSAAFASEPQKSMRLIVAEAADVESRSAYFAWRRVLLRLLELESDSTPEAIARRLMGLCADAPNLLEWLPVLNDVLPCGLPEDITTQRMNGSTRADSVAAIVTHLLLRQAGDLPTVLVIEDVHWLDSASWRLLARVQSDQDKLLLVLTSRDGEPREGDDRSRVLSHPGVIMMTLGPLSRAETGVLACRSLGVVSLDDGLLELVHARTEGHPLFAQEAVKRLRESGYITTDGGHAQLVAHVREKADSLLPRSVEKSIATRFDGLPLAYQRMLHVASVLGFDFTPEQLCGIQAESPAESDIEQQLSLAQVLGLVRRSRAELPPRYVFGHAITREVVYSLLPPSQRRHLHAKVANWLEGAHAPALSEVFPLLAHHWSLSDNAGKAVRYLGLAGEQSLLRHGYREAVGFLQQASTLFRDNPSLASDAAIALCERLLGHAWLGLGELQRARHHLEASFAAGRRPMPCSNGDYWLGAMSECLVQIANRLRGAPGRAAIPLARASERSDCHALFRLGHIAWFQSDTRSLLYTGLRALNAAEREGPTLDLACLCAGMATIAGAVGLHRLARRYIRHSYAVADRLGDPRAAAQVGVFSALYGAGIGEWEQALEQSSRSIELSQRLGDSRHLDECSVTAAYVHLHLGQYASAVNLFEACARRGRSRGDNQTLAWGLLGVARVHVLCGSLEAAGLALAQAEAAVVDRLSAIELHGQRALVRLHEAAYEVSAREARLGLELIQQTRPLSFSILVGMASITQVFLVLWARARQLDDLEQAVSCAARARAALTSLRQFSRVFPIGLPFCLLLRGQCAWIERRPARALAMWRAALAASTRLKMPHELAAARSILARHAQLPHRAAGVLRLSQNGGAPPGDAEVEPGGATDLDIADASVAFPHRHALALKIPLATRLHS